MVHLLNPQLNPRPPNHEFDHVALCSVVFVLIIQERMVLCLCLHRPPMTVHITQRHLLICHCI